MLKPASALPSPTQHHKAALSNIQHYLSPTLAAPSTPEHHTASPSKVLAPPGNTQHHLVSCQHLPATSSTTEHQQAPPSTIRAEPHRPVLPSITQHLGSPSHLAPPSPPSSPSIARLTLRRAATIQWQFLVCFQARVAPGEGQVHIPSSQPLYPQKPPKTY